MTLNANLIEQLAEWCLRSDTLADIRATARGDFFGYDEPSEARYMEGAGDVTRREAASGAITWPCFAWPTL